MSQLYKAAPPQDLILHELDSMTLIFQKSSGITHIVADPVPAILEVMEGNAHNSADIAAKLSNSFDLEGDFAVEDIVLARLEELCSLGLVERI